jgi:hypothetical protein
LICDNKTVPYGLRSENCFQIFFTKIDPFGPRTEKKPELSQNCKNFAFSEVEFWEKGPLFSELDF